jgi:hypothetical protein
MTTESVAPRTLNVWAIYLQASEEARRRGDRRTGTDHLLLALFEDPSIEAVLGVNLPQARQALESLDHEALGALGLGSGTEAPPLPMHAVPKKPRLRDVAQKDRLRMTPAAKKVLEEASKPNRRRLYVTAQQVLAQILTLQPPDPAAVLLGALGVWSHRTADSPAPFTTSSKGAGIGLFHGGACGLATGLTTIAVLRVFRVVD